MTTTGSAQSSSAGRPPRALASRVVDLFAARMAGLHGTVETELHRPTAAGGPVGEFVLDLARETWRTVSDLAATGPAGVIARLVASGADLDDCGIDRRLSATVRDLLRPASRLWLGIDEDGGAALPPTGPVLLLFNRSPWPLPVEALVLMAVLGDGRLAGRGVAALWEEEEIPEFPWLGDLLRQIGIVPATATNAAALLDRGFVVVGFPEGKAARARTYDRRYRIGGCTAKGLVEAALETGAALVPGAVLGSEESFPLLGRFAGLPVTAQFPLLGAAGLLPLPVNWRLRLGPPVEAGRPGTDGSDGTVQACEQAVVSRIQALLADLLAARTSIVRG